MVNLLKTLPVVVVALAAAGCLQSDVTHTVYLSPEGQVTWVVEERMVRSDVADPAGRRSEEEAYLVEAKEGTSRLARALSALGPDGPVRTRVLRDERPFHVVTDARYDSVEHLMAALFAPYARVAVERSGEETTLTIVFDLTKSELEQQEGNPATEALLDIEKYVFVLTEGEFVSGSGFDVKGQSASFSAEWLKQLEDAAAATVPAPLVLTWKK